MIIIGKKRLLNGNFRLGSIYNNSLFGNHYSTSKPVTNVKNIETRGFWKGYNLSRSSCLVFQSTSLIENVDFFETVIHEYNVSTNKTRIARPRKIITRRIIPPAYWKVNGQTLISGPLQVLNQRCKEISKSFVAFSSRKADEKMLVSFEFFCVAKLLKKTYFSTFNRRFSQYSSCWLIFEANEWQSEIYAPS